MGYATLAGLPIQVGLYTAFVPMIVYSLLGSSRVLSVSTTSTLAVLDPNENFPHGIAILPYNEDVVGFATTDNWLLATAGEPLPCKAQRSWKLYAAPLHGGALVVLAEGLALPAVVSPAGATYVDVAGRLMALPRDQLQTAFMSLE